MKFNTNEISIRLFSYGALGLIFFLFFLRPSYSGDIEGMASLIDRALVTPWMDLFIPSENGFRPSLIYTFFGVGVLKSLLGLSSHSSIYLFLHKGLTLLLHIFCCAWVIHHLRTLNNQKKYSLSQIRWLGLAVLLNPALLYNAIVSGKTDILWVTSLTLAVLFTMKRHVPATLLCLGFTVFFEPVVTLPAVVVVFLYQCWRERGAPSIPKMCCLIGPPLLLCAPFLTQKTAYLLFRPFDRHFASANAFNFHTLLGNNFTDAHDPLIFGINSVWLGYGLVLLALFGLVGLFVRAKKRHGDWSTEQSLLAGLLILFVFLFFSPYVHENHHLLVLPFFFATFLRSRKVLFAFVLFSMGSIVDQAAAVETVNGGRALLALQPLVLFSVLLKISVFVLVAQRFFHPVQESPLRLPNISELRSDLISMLHRWPQPFSLKKTDFAVLVVLASISIALIFTRLGNPDYRIPQTTIENEFNGTVHFDKHEVVESFWIYLSKGRSRLEFLCDSNRGFNVLDPSYANGWLYQKLEKPCSGSMTLRVAPYKESRTGDIQFVTRSRQGIIPKQICPRGESCQTGRTHPLFDDLSDETASPTFFHSGYFDEAFYSTSALNHLNGQPWFEKTHPPLGKIWIAYSLKFFGQSPWAWRLPGATMACSLFFLLFLFSRELFGSRLISYTVATLAILDFSTLGIGRMATLDNQITFWILLCALLFLKGLRPIVQRGLKAQFFWTRRDYLYCAVFALCFGLGAATKWIMAYSIFAYIVLVLSFGLVFFHFPIPRRFHKQSFYAVLLFFAVSIPMYMSSFVPYVADTPITENGGFFREFLAHQKHMFGFHSNALHPHQYASRYYSWLTVDRPLMAYTKLMDTKRIGIAIFGNPLIWWAILPALLICLIRGWLRSSFPVFVSAVFFLAHFLVWGLIGRTTYIYHFFPSALFGILLISAVIAQKKWLAYAYVAACLVLLALYFPVLTGIPVSMNYADAIAVFPTWMF